MQTLQEISSSKQTLLPNEIAENQKVIYHWESD